MQLSVLTLDEQAELIQRLEQREKYAADSHRMEMEADFGLFVRDAWEVVRPGLTLNWSWHYDLIGEYLTLVYERKIRRLVVNISPRTLKSILVSVMFPVWVWTKDPTHNFACASYSEGLSTEHSVMRRLLIESDWFKQHWGDSVYLAADQNQKTKFKNNHQAQMIATSVGGTATGLGGNTLILDDGMNPQQAASEAERKTAQEWFDQTWRTRLNNQATDALIIVEQRTNERDISGHVLANDEMAVKIDASYTKEWTHLCLPLEAEENERWVFPISGRVVTRKIGEILQPDRFPPVVVQSLKKLRLVWAGQYQQHPAPLEGNMIKRSEIRFYGGVDPVTGVHDPPLPEKFDLTLVSADCAFKDTATSDYVAVGAIGTSGPRRYILNVVNRHLDEPATEAEILRQRATYRGQTTLVEDKANGPAVISKLRKKIPGVVEVNPQGGKVARMYAVCGEWQSGDWYVDRNAAWTEPFIEQITKFPNAANDDMVDMMTQAGVYLQSHSNGLLGLWKQQAEAKRVADEAEPKRTEITPEFTRELAEQQKSGVEGWMKSTKKVTGTKNLGKVATAPQQADGCPNCGNHFPSKYAEGRCHCNACGHDWVEARKK